MAADSQGIVYISLRIKLGDQGLKEGELILRYGIAVDDKDYKTISMKHFFKAFQYSKGKSK